MVPRNTIDTAHFCHRVLRVVFDDTYLAKKNLPIWKFGFANFASYSPSFFIGYPPSPSLASLWKFGLVSFILQVFI